MENEVIRRGRRGKLINNGHVEFKGMNRRSNEGPVLTALKIQKTHAENAKIQREKKTKRGEKKRDLEESRVEGGGVGEGRRTKGQVNSL